MVLGEPGDRIAELVGEPGLLGNLGKHLRRSLFRLARAHQVEDAEFHRALRMLDSRHGERSTGRPSSERVVECGHAGYQGKS